MSLWWLMKEFEGKRRFFIQDAVDLLNARLKSETAGFEDCLGEIGQPRGDLIVFVAALQHVVIGLARPFDG